MNVGGIILAYKVTLSVENYYTDHKRGTSNVKWVINTLNSWVYVIFTRSMY